MKIITLLSFFIIITILSSCSIDKKVIWIQQAGDINSKANGFSISSDHLGNVYTTGNFSGKIAFSVTETIESENENDCFISKYNKEGKLQWVRTISGAFDQSGNSIIVDNHQDIIVVGNFYEEIKIDQTKLKAKGNADIFIAKYNSEGVLLWYKVFGSFRMDDAHEVKVDNSNNIYVAGRLSDSIKIDNVILKSHGGIDGFIIKFNPDGKLLFGKTIGGNEDDDIDDIFVDNKNNIFISGVVNDSVFFDSNLILSTGNLNQYFAKINHKGNLSWIKTYGDDANHEIWDMNLDTLGNIYLTGYHSGAITIDNIKYPSLSNGDFSMYLVKFTEKKGNLEWFRHFLTKGNGYGHSIAIDENNNILLSGTFYESIQLDRKKHTTKRGSANVLLKFNQQGKILDKHILSNNGSVDLWEINISKFDNHIIGVGRFTRKLNKEIKTGDKKDVLVIKLKNE
tara:strand:+ start:4894 stop:6252 length:1359 start_codon:yes stop_codon:yes gene_type:complete